MEITKITNINLHLCFEYMKVRAKQENVKWKLTINDYLNLFKEGLERNDNAGVNMFGLEISVIGFPLWDEQEPSKGFLNSFISFYFINN